MFHQSAESVVSANRKSQYYTIILYENGVACNRKVSKRYIHAV